MSAYVNVDSIQIHWNSCYFFCEYNLAFEWSGCTCQMFDPSAKNNMGQHEQPGNCGSVLNSDPQVFAHSL